MEGSKTFRFRVPPNEIWGSLAPLKERDLPLYGAELMATAPMGCPVYYVEGEKAADACRAAKMLVVSHVGGADQDDLGDAFSVLRGRIVRLWADNDEAGQRCMARIAAKLKGIAARVSQVNVPLSLPEKGDAADYFAIGGTVELLEFGQLDQPAVEYLSYDAVRVRVPTTLAVASFTFTEIEKVGRAFEAELEISLEGAGDDPYTQRINLLSSSAQESLRRSMDAMYGKEAGWTGIINTAIARARRAYIGQELAQRADTIPDPGPQEWQIDTIAPKNAAVVLFSDGGKAKTYQALGWMVAVANGWPYLGYGTRQGAVLYIDYETDKSTWRRRVRRIYQGLEIETVPPAPHYYWPGRGIPLVDQIERIRLFVEREGVSLVIVDSAAAACGGKPEDAEITLRYFSALAKLPGVTSVTIAHIPKGSSPDRPFGSTFWYNQPRRLWYVAGSDEEESDFKDVALVCTKVNDGLFPRPIGLRITFDGDDGPVRFSPSELQYNPAAQARRPLRARIWDIMAEPMTAYEIAEALGMVDKVDTVAATLRAGRVNHFAEIAAGNGRGNQTTWARKTD